jgi:ElaB/YqjD/DUF883 family membrane-anchored ribosome-binding protein
MMHDVELLQYVYKTADMGCEGIQSVIRHTKSTALKDKLKAQDAEYQKIRHQAQALLEARNERPGGVGLMGKAAADIMSAGKMMVDQTDSKIAEMVIQGNQMGINKTIKHLHDYDTQDSTIRTLVEKLLATEESNADQLKAFL